MTKKIKEDHFIKIKKELNGLNTLADVARVFETTPRKLAFILYNDKNRDNLYTEYTIPKKSGGKRKIAAPTASLSILQFKLNKLLQKIYSVRPSAHAFINNRSIKTNALVHHNKKFVLNLDLSDFFGSINFGRVRGLFMSAPYSLNSEVATIFAQIACYKKALPQGARTSPIISNMICSKLDGELQRFAKTNKCFYSRYADDITFSTNLKEFPHEVATIIRDKTKLSKALVDILKVNGFDINDKKVYLQDDNFRQVVTGLVVNEFPNVHRKYIRNLRATMYKWEKLGIKAVSDEYFTKYCNDSKKDTKDFRKIIRGKLEFVHSVRTHRNPKIKAERLKIFYKLLDWYFVNSLRDSGKKTIRTEGKTDWMHYYAAYKELRATGAVKKLGIKFFKTKENLFYGDGKQISFCERVANQKINPFKNKIICIFDSDVPSVVNQHKSGPKKYSDNVLSIVTAKKNAGNWVYDLSVELMYSDKDLKRTLHGRRLFLDDEFNDDGSHKTNKNLKYVGKEKKSTKPKVIDSDVIDVKTGKRACLSKNEFARAVLKKADGFEGIDFNNL